MAGKVKYLYDITIIKNIYISIKLTMLKLINNILYDKNDLILLQIGFKSWNSYLNKKLIS